MTTTDQIDTGFAPWSLMTPDPEVSKRGAGTPVQEARIHPRDDETFQATDDKGYMFGDDGFTFGDFLDVINPLQHLPLIGPIYRSLTGDEIDPGAKVAGSTLFGGPIGLAAGLVNAMVEDATGDGVGENALAFFFGDDEGVGADALAAAPQDKGFAAGTPPPVQVASLANVRDDGSTPGFAELASLYGVTANAGAVSSRQMPAARYGAPAGQSAGTVDLASAMFAANGNSYAAANVAAFNQGAYRRNDLAGAAKPEQTVEAAQFDTPRAQSGATQISRRMADHLAKLAGQPQSQPVSSLAAQSQPSIPAVAPRTITGPLPQAFSADAPEGNPFAVSQPSAAPLVAAPPVAPTMAATQLQANTVSAAIARAESPAAGFDNPNDIVRAMTAAIERYEQQRALQPAG